MRVLLVNPPRFGDDHIPVTRESRCENCERNTVTPPTSYVYMAGILKENGHKVNLLDCNAYDLNFTVVEDTIKKRSPDTVIFRSTPSTFFHDCRVSEIAKKYGIRTIMLNWNLSAFSKQAMELVPSLDVYVTAYNYENVINDVVEGKIVTGTAFREAGRVVEIPQETIKKVGDIPRPPWEMIPDHSFYYTRARALSPWAVVRGSSGCGFRCKMCIDCGIPWDPRSPSLVVEEVEQLVMKHGVKHVSFFDNTFNINKKWTEEVCSRLEEIEKPFKWYINSRPDMIFEEQTKMMARAGLDTVSLGVEAGTDEMLDVIHKGFTVERAYDAIGTLKKQGVKVFLALMMGMPGETKEQMEATKDLVLKTKPHGFQINIVTPYPGTPLYEESINADMITPGLSWDAMSCVPTGLKETVSLAEMSSDELIKLRQKFYRQLYMSPKYLLPNIWWSLTHPADFKIAVSYAFGLAKNLWHKGAYTH